MNYISIEYVLQHKTTGNDMSFKTICPVCLGHNLYVTMYNRFAYCFNCASSFRVGEGDYIVSQHSFPLGEIRSIYAEVARYYHSCVTSDISSFLYERGLPLSVVEDFFIGYCPAKPLHFGDPFVFRRYGIIRADGIPTLSNRIVFPYIAEQTTTDLRGRLFFIKSGESCEAKQMIPHYKYAFAEKQESKDDINQHTYVREEPKYKSLPFSSQQRGAVYPYNWDRALAKAEKTNKLIITEGEIKTIAADIRGYPICGLPGMNSWRPALIPRPEWDVIVIFDSMRGRERDLLRAFSRIARKVKNLFVGILPLLGEDKMDIDTLFLKPKGEQLFENVVKNPIPYSDYVKLRR